MTSDDKDMKQTPEFSDRDLDALFDGREVSDGRLRGVAAAFSAMRSVLVGTVGEEHAAQMGARLAAVASSVEAEPARPHRAARWRRRFTAIGATAALAVVAVGGAAAANHAAPGDALYGVDRALERVGLLDGGLGERLSEAHQLAARGDAVRALTHAADAYTANAEPEVATALHRAADAVAGGAVANDEVLSVGDMLEWMATAERGEDFGSRVSEWARGLGSHRGASVDDATEPSQRPTHAGRPGVQPERVGPPTQSDTDDDVAPTPGGPAPHEGSGGADGSEQVGEPGKPDHAGEPGKPDHVGEPGKPDHVGEPGKPDHAGEPGKPDHAGRGKR